MTSRNCIIAAAIGRVALIASLALMFCGCQKTGVTSAMNPDNKIRFNIGVENTRVTTSVDSASDMTTFGVYSVFEDRDNQDLFNNTEITVNSNGTTSYDNERAISYNQYETIEFMAYSPHMTTATYTNNILTIPSYDIANGEQEFLVAHTTQEMNDNNVSIAFDHTMSALQFKVKGNPFVEIVSMSISSIYTSGAMTYETTTGTAAWTTGTTANGGNLTIPIHDDITLRSDIYQTLSDGYAIMMPQTLPDNSKLTIEISEDDGSTVTRTLELELNNDTWEAKKIHTYSLNIKSNQIECFDFSVAEWDDGADFNSSTDNDVTPAPEDWINLDDYTTTDALTARCEELLNKGITEFIVVGTKKYGVNLGATDYSSAQYRIGLNAVVTKEDVTIGAIQIDLSRVHDLTEISNYMFYKTTTIESVVLPETVTTIGAYAFSCTSLTSIDIPETVTTISSAAFSNCSSLTSIVIPKNVTTIGSSAFGNCTSLASLVITCEITTINTYTFNRCTSLTSLTIPTSVTTLGDEAFASCQALETVTGLSNVTQINYRLFYNCKSLKSVDLPSKLTSIPSRCFYQCENLYSVGDLSGVTSIGDHAFNGCKKLQSIKTSTALTKIGSSAFSGCEILTSLGDLSQVTEIGKSAFLQSLSLETLDLPSVTTVGDYAFTNCLSLYLIKLPSATKIGYKAFRGLKDDANIYLTSADGIDMCYYIDSYSDYWINYNLHIKKDKILDTNIIVTPQYATTVDTQYEQLTYTTATLDYNDGHYTWKSVYWVDEDGTETDYVHPTATNTTAQ